MPRKKVTLSKYGKVMGRPVIIKKEKNAGRPGLFQPIYCGFAQELATQKLTDEQISEKLKITKKTYYIWRNTYPEFRDAIDFGRRVILTALAQSALLKALEGGNRRVYKETIVKDKDGSIKEIRHETSDFEVLPCKDTALRHLMAVDPSYKSLQNTINIAPVLSGLDNLDKLAEELRRQDEAKQIDIKAAEKLMSED